MCFWMACGLRCVGKPHIESISSTMQVVYRVWAPNPKSRLLLVVEIGYYFVKNHIYNNDGYTYTQYLRAIKIVMEGDEKRGNVL